MAEQAAASQPFVSVVIPMRNEEESIADCVDAVLRQDYPPELLEIIVVDGDSDDRSVEMVEKLAEVNAGRVRLLHNPKRIVPPALNTAIRAARGTVIARVDGHTRIAGDYVRVGVETLNRTNAENVGGPMIAVGGGLWGNAVARVTSSRFGVGSYFHFGTEEREVDTVYLGMWPRSVFAQIGLFDEELVRNQDDELNYRLRKHGGRVVMNPDMRSAYQNRQSLSKLAKQYWQYGLWKVRVLQKHPRQMSWRHFVPPAFVAALLSFTALSPWSTIAAQLAVIVISIYAVAVVALAANLSAADGWRAWAAAAVTFAVIHVCWGAGFLAGLVRFAPRWMRPESAPPQWNEGLGEVVNEGVGDTVAGKNGNGVPGRAS